MRRLVFVVLGVIAVAVAARARSRPAAFDHRAHAEVFPACVACHAGVIEPGAPLWPAPQQCATCHDGTTEERVDWAPPIALPATNLRFDHPTHRREAGDTVACVACHVANGGAWMDVRLADANQCVACHGLGTAHLAVAPAECPTCHVPLAQAARLDEARVADLPEPPGHRAADFAARHGARVDASCATCHTREFCATCHVDAALRPEIVALGSNPIGGALAVGLRAPASHAAPAFLETHGPAVNAGATECRTCHTQESCLSCHRGTPQVAAGLAVGQGRIGARVTRHAPPDHSRDFIDGRHGAAADLASTRCAACHVRSQCLECHRAGPDGNAYHPADFLSRHPAAAYARETTCTDCHNPTGFCAGCHQQAGLVAADLLQGGFHDGKVAFLFGHGPSARRSLESCVSCHTETDCLVCHSSVRGRGFNPHGADFDADRLRRRNPEMCVVCHGAAIPGAE